jgi:hypothetical protein
MAILNNFFFKVLNKILIFYLMQSMLLITIHIAIVNAKYEKYFNILHLIHKN